MRNRPSSSPADLPVPWYREPWPWLLAGLLSLDSLFRSDLDDGSLEQFLLAPHPLPVLVSVCNSIGVMLVSGMVIGTVFTLFVVPSIYMLLARTRGAEKPLVEKAEDEKEAVPEIEPVMA